MSDDRRRLTWWRCRRAEKIAPGPGLALRQHGLCRSPSGRCPSSRRRRLMERPVSGRDCPRAPRQSHGHPCGAATVLIEIARSLPSHVKLIFQPREAVPAAPIRLSRQVLENRGRFDFRPATSSRSRRSRWVYRSGSHDGERGFLLHQSEDVRRTAPGRGRRRSDRHGFADRALACRRSSAVVWNITQAPAVGSVLAVFTVGIEANSFPTRSRPNAHRAHPRRGRAHSIHDASHIAPEHSESAGRRQVEFGLATRDHQQSALTDRMRRRGAARRRRRQCCASARSPAARGFLVLSAEVPGLFFFLG